MKLTDKYIRGLKTPEARYEISDDGHPLWLIVSTTGKKTFQWRGRLDGKSTRKNLTPDFPELSLADARLEAGLLKKGARETAAKRPSLLQPIIKGMTVQEAFDIYIVDDGKRGGARKRTAGEIQRMWDHDCKDKIGSVPIKELTRDQVEDVVLEKAKTTGFMANRLLGTIGGFLTWAVKKRFIDQSPATLIDKPQEETERLLSLSDDQLSVLLATIHEAQAFAPIFEFTLRSLVRVGNVLSMTWNMVKEDEVFFPLTKNGEEHDLMMPRQMIALLPKRPADAKGSDNIWGLETKADRARYSAMHKRWRREAIKLAEKLELEIKPFAKIEDRVTPDFVSDFRIHDFRGTGTSWLRRYRDENKKRAFGARTSKSLLGHARQGVTEKHYDDYDYDEEKIHALTIWSRHLDQLKASPRKLKEAA